MTSDQQRYLDLILKNKGISFGDFTTKSGRQSPYFIDTGSIHTGDELYQLTEVYSTCICEHLEGKQIQNVYGPAYKGIPLAISCSYNLSKRLKKEVSFSFNRKEKKDHGEGGELVGYQYRGGESVIVVEDILTGGVSLKQTFEFLKSNYQITPQAAIVGIDRQEKGMTTNLSAKDELSKVYGIPIFSILWFFVLRSYLFNKTLSISVPSSSPPRCCLSTLLIKSLRSGTHSLLNK